MGDTASQESGEGGGSDQEGRRRTDAATAHSGDARPKPGWGPGMERGVALKLSERKDLMSVPLGVAKPESE